MAPRIRCNWSTVHHPVRADDSIHDVEAKYYADGEDAFDMRKALNPKQPNKAAPETATKKQPALVSTWLF